MWFGAELGPFANHPYDHIVTRSVADLTLLEPQSPPVPILA
jgi:hypothetical protein